MRHPVRRFLLPRIARRAFVTVCAALGACAGPTLEPVDATPSGGWDTLQEKMDECEPLSPDPCERIVCSAATTIATCQGTEETSYCQAVLECLDAYYRCVCPEDEFQTEAMVSCAQAYETCQLRANYQE